MSELFDGGANGPSESAVGRGRAWPRMHNGWTSGGRENHQIRNRNRNIQDGSLRCLRNESTGQEDQQDLQKDSIAWDPFFHEVQPTSLPSWIPENALRPYLSTKQWLA